MKFSEEFRDQALVKEAARRLGRLALGPATIMEVCGTHTMSVARFGLKSLLPPNVRLVSGPGCLVCVTDQGDIDAFLALGHLPDAVLATFGERTARSFSTTQTNVQLHALKSWRRVSVSCGETCMRNAIVVKSCGVSWWSAN